MARDERVYFKISGEKKSELEEWAQNYGVTVSALCAIIVGEWLHGKKTDPVKNVEEMLMAFMKDDLEELKKDAENRP